MKSEYTVGPDGVTRHPTSEQAKAACAMIEASLALHGAMKRCKDLGLDMVDRHGKYIEPWLVSGLKVQLPEEKMPAVIMGES